VATPTVPTVEGPAARIVAAGPSAVPAAVRRAAGAIPLAVRLPAVLVAASMFVPVAYLVMVAAQLPPARILAIALDPATLALARRSIGLALTVTVASVLIAVPIAWLTERTDLPARRTLGVAAALPLVIPTYVGAFALVSALGPGGLVAVVTGWTPPSPYGFRGAAVALTLFSYPYVLLTVRGALRGLDPALEEASRTLGRRSGATFLRVVLPQLRPAIAAGGLLVSLYVLSDFGAVAMLRTQTFTRAIFLQYRTAFDRAPAAVLGIMLVLITVLVLALESRVGRADRTHLARSGPAREAPRVALGRWRWPAALLVGAVLVVALVLPLVVVGWWLVRGVGAGQQLDAALVPMLRTLAVAALGALAATLAALPVALWSARDASRAARLTERVSHLGYALPGIVVAFALVSFGIRTVPALYQTVWMLVIAYVVLFLPQAVGAQRASLLQVDTDVDAAARTLGASPGEVVRRVLLPLSRSGVAAGATLVFLTIVKELPATLLLAPTGFATLATRVWSATDEAFYARAALPALLLVLVGSLPLAVAMVRQERRTGRGPDASGRGRRAHGAEGSSEERVRPGT
jgi:iron(III) transport system permease protein